MFKKIKQIKFNSIRFKVSLFYTGILGLILVLYTTILFVGQRYALYHDLDNELAIKAQGIASGLNYFIPVLENNPRSFRSLANTLIQQRVFHPGEGELSEAQRKWLETSEKLNIHESYIVLASADGEAIANSQNIDAKLLPYFMQDISGSAEKAVSFRNINFGSNRLRYIIVPYYYKSRRMYFIEVGASRAPIIKSLHNRILFASFTIPLILVFTSFLGAMIAERILKPVKEVANIAKNITYKDLSARVKVENVDEELSYLVAAFNEMISRLDNSFRYIDEFSSNVAHELKTPLTIISGESELALMQERDIEEYKRVVEVNFREAGQMLKIVEDLLLLSKLEHQPEAFKFEQIDLNVFLEEVFEQAKKLSLPKNINVSLHLPDISVCVLADWLHLRRLFINLLNNAVKFSPQAGLITIAVKAQKQNVSVSVSDTGIGIAPDNLDKVLRRFFRVDNFGLTDKTGSGLGLSIAQSIAKIHHGDIHVSSELGKGSVFTVTLPNCKTPILL